MLIFTATIPFKFTPSASYTDISPFGEMSDVKKTTGSELSGIFELSLLEELLPPVEDELFPLAEAELLSSVEDELLLFSDELVFDDDVV